MNDINEINARPDSRAGDHAGDRELRPASGPSVGDGVVLRGSDGRVQALRGLVDPDGL